MSEKWIFKKKQLICYSIIFLIYLLVLLSFLSEAIAEPVNIPDPVLRRVLEGKFGKGPGDIITQAEIGAKSFKIFIASDKNISDLTGLEYATNLDILYLDGNSISDLSPLSNLTGLTELYLSHNQISDISPISNISAMYTLGLGNNNLTNLDDLPDLSAADTLYFQYNQITNIEALVDHTEFASLNGRYEKAVNFEGNPLDDVSINTHLQTLRNRYIEVYFPLNIMKKISGDNQELPVNTMSQPFVVEICDINNNPLSGEKIRFQIGWQGNFVNGTDGEGWSSTLYTITNVEGRASATLITGSAPGSYLVHPWVQGASSKTFRVTVIERSPSQQQEPPPQQEDTQQEDTQQEDTQQEDTQQEDTQQEDTQQEDTQQEDTQQEDTQQEDTQQEDTQQEDTQQEDTQQEDTQQEDTQQEDTQPQPVNPNPQPEPESEPEPNYTIIPFDYEKEGVGKVVFSELMLTRLGKYPQWIELYNTTDQDIDINGWKIVGRYLDDSNVINILESQVISKYFTIKGKETVLIVSFAIPNSRDRISKGLTDKVYALKTNPKNFWNYKGLVLELQDAEGNPIDRIGNLNEADEVVWEIPMVVRNKRISLIRRLKPIRSQAYNFTFGIKEFGWFPAEKVKGLTENRIQYYYGRYTDIGSPGYRTEDGEVLPVTLSSFSPQLNKNGQIILSWITESELENAGFNILRSQTPQGPFVKVNPKLIQGAGTTGERSSYTWKDTTAKPNVEYYYRIEDVSYAGKHQTLTTTRLKGLISVKNRFTTRWAQLKSRR